MLKNLIKETLAGALKRLGTVGATVLIAGGDWLCTEWNACGLVTQDGAAQVMTYVIAVSLLLVDLAFEWVDRRARSLR